MNWLSCRQSVPLTYGLEAEQVSMTYTMRKSVSRISTCRTLSSHAHRARRGAAFLPSGSQPEAQIACRSRPGLPYLYRLQLLLPSASEQSPPLEIRAAGALAFARLARATQRPAPPPAQAGGAHSAYTSGGHKKKPSFYPFFRG